VVVRRRIGQLELWKDRESPRFVRGPSVRFSPSRAPQMQVEPRPSLDALARGSEKHVRGDARLGMPSRAPRGHSHAMQESKKKKNRPLLGHTHDDKERSELLL